MIKLPCFEIRNIPGFNKDYFVDSEGNIYSQKSGKIKQRKVGDDHRGYLICGIQRDDGVNYPLKVHHAVLYAFVGPRPSSRHVALHGDDDGYNNKLENLKWGTTRQNQKDKLKNLSNNKRKKSHKKKCDSEKRLIIKRMLKSGFFKEEICLLTAWPISKLNKELLKC